MSFSFIAKDYDELKAKVDNGSATPEEIATFIDYCVEVRTEKARLELEMQMQDSEIAQRIEESKAREAKTRMELDLLTLDALERLNNVEE